MLRFRTILQVALVAAVMGACKDASGPDFRYPEVAGLYDYDGFVNGLAEARFTGTMTLVDDSRDTPEFAGTFTITLSGGGIQPLTLSGSVLNARVTENGDMFFDLDGSDYHHTGTLAGGRITGSWVLIGSTSSFSGTYTAIRR